jgi:hypothetical protein
MENMENISNKTRKHYFKAMEKMPNKSPSDYRMKRMAIRLQCDFDKVWLLYEKGEVTFVEWKKSLHKWLQAELI